MSRNVPGAPGLHKLARVTSCTYLCLTKAII